MNAAQRRMRAALGGLTTASRHNPLTYTSKARSTWLAGFAPDDPGLSEAERERRAAAALRARMVALALRSSQVRAARAQGGTA